MNVHELKYLVKKQLKNRSLPLELFRRPPREIDPDLALIDTLINDAAINAALPLHYRTGRPPYKPCQLVRAHLLKVLKHIPSFNKLVKELRVHRNYRWFCKLPNKKSCPSAGTLSHFRQWLTDLLRLRLLNVFIAQALKLGLLDNCSLWIADASDIESPCSSKSIGHIIEGGKRKEIYRDPTARKGHRANKKGRSKYFIGHKKHTLGLYCSTTATVIPLISVIEPADVFENQVLTLLVELGQSLGLDIRYIIADTAYIDTDLKENLYEDKGIILMTDKKSNTRLPERCSSSGQPNCRNDVAMTWLEYDPEQNQHYYGCGHNEPEFCPFYLDCPHEQAISQKEFAVAFGTIPVHTTIVRRALGKRKQIEPTFYRNKYRSGLEKVTLKGKENVAVLACFSDICEILHEMCKLIYQKTYTKAA